MTGTDTSRFAAARACLARALEEGLRLPAPAPGNKDASASTSARFRVRRAWPRRVEDATGGYVLELTDGSGSDGAVFGAILDSEGARMVGDDPALPRLRPLRAARLRLIAHRPGKRAVLRDPNGDFVKLARPSATARAVRRADTVEALLRRATGSSGRSGRLAPAVPRRVLADPEGGELRLAPAPGRPLAAILAAARDDAGAPPASSAAPVEAAEVVELVADALLVLAGIGPAAGGGKEPAVRSAPEVSPADLPLHSFGDEAEVLRRWAASALALAPLAAEDGARLAEEVPRVTAALESAHERGSRSAPSLVLAHRDLHDGQILATKDGLTFLDWDTAAWADPACDLANLLAHVDRAGAPAVFADRLLARLADAGHPALRDDAARERLSLLREATALRLLAVHGFRPVHATGSNR